MRRALTVVAGLVVITSLTNPAGADPIPATVSLTVEPNGSAITYYPYVYSVWIPDLNTRPSSVGLLGSGSVVSGSGVGESIFPAHIPIQTTFNMTITLDGASGSHPSIVVEGTVTGSYDVTDIPQSSPLWAAGFNISSYLTVQGVATSAKLEGWTSNSGVPMSLISQYLNPSIYSFSQQGSGGNYMVYPSYPDLAGTTLFINLPDAAETPEPATVLVYVAAIVGLVVRLSAQRWWSSSAR
jgi:hypothetical protein